MLLSEKSTQIKEHLSWEASINMNNNKKIWFVYTCLDSSTLVYIGLDSSAIL